MTAGGLSILPFQVAIETAIYHLTGDFIWAGKYRSTVYQVMMLFALGALPTMQSQ